MLLSAIGSWIKFLGLDYHEGGFEDILRHCPNLQELTFCGGLAVFRFNFSNYDGEIDQFDYDWRDIPLLAQALSENKNPSRSACAVYVSVLTGDALASTRAARTFTTPASKRISRSC